jgi:DNA-binding NarL/FixJ family response regulator
MKKIVLAEDHAIIRDGLKLLIATRSNLQVVAETGDGSCVEQLVRANAADLLLLDLDLPGCHGIELTRKLKSALPQVRILILTANAQPVAVKAAIQAGADGYLLKHEDAGELLHAIALVLSGITYISKALAQMSDMLAPGGATADTTVAITAREREILALIANGESSLEIAEKLHLSVLTVRKHRQNLMSKLSLHNVAEVTAYALRDHGLPR